jgi:tetratricopeptide (TPR) repeat protein
MNMRTEPSATIVISAARDVASVPAADPAARVPEVAQPFDDPQSSGAPVPPDASRKAAADDKRRRLPPRPGPVRRPVAAADDKDPKTAPALLRQAKAAEDASKWNEARAAYQRLEKFRPYRSEAMFGQAWTAFQMNDTRAAEQLAGQLATEGGPFKVKAMFLYADALYMQSQYARAKVIYQKLHTELKGDRREIAQKKIVACNKELNLPEASGID